LENVRAENPFPGVCGRVCFHPCEERCNRKEFDEGLAINALERAVFEYGKTKKIKKPGKGKKTGKKVAIIGSGPAGMTCSYFLALLGHDVTVFEALSVPGGIPRVAIPEYRLPRDVIDQEINQISELGIHVRTNTEVGKKIPFKDIIGKFDACFISTGVHRSLKLNIPGEDSKRVLLGLDFLKAVTFGKKIALGAKVVVIGGGNVAIDAARTAKRLGAEAVQLVCLESREIMPAYWSEVEGAEKEGIKILYQTMPVQIHSKGKRVELECKEVRGGKRDKIGWSEWPKAIEGTNFTVDADTIIVAIGAAPDAPFLPKTIEMKGRLIKVDYLGRTSVTGIYAGGDATMPAGSVVEAIGSGKRAALGIDIFLKCHDEKQIVKAVQKGENGAISMGKYLAGDYTSENDYVVAFTDLNTEYFTKLPRAQVDELPAAKRSSNFKEVSLGVSKTKAIEESVRCFHCGRCNLCKKCYIACPIEAIRPVSGANYVAININKSYCGSCGVCVKECPCGVISWVYGKEATAG
jgi:heterodisulfide reductase subunit A